MATGGPKLSYLFTALYHDDTRITQTPEDVSATEADRSAFYDVLQRGTPFAFVIDNGTHTWAVDLRDGHFEHDGQDFWMHQDDEVPVGTQFRLVYYRRNTMNFNQTGEVVGHHVRHFIGWQVTVGGKNIQRIVGVD